MNERIYTSRRYAIAEALADKLKEIDGSGDYAADITQNVSTRLQFWDEINTFPAVFVVTGDESRVYQGGGYKDRFLTITIHCYVNENNALRALEALIEDIETVLEVNGRLAFEARDHTTQCTRDMLITNISTDEGVLEPIGVAQISVEVQY